MPIPTRFDADTAEIDAMHGVVMVRLKTQHFSRTKPERVREALDAYVAAVKLLAGIE